MLGGRTAALMNNAGPGGAVTVKGPDASSAGSVGKAMRQQAHDIAPFGVGRCSQQLAHIAPLWPLAVSMHTPAVICAMRTAMARHLFITLEPRSRAILALSYTSSQHELLHFSCSLPSKWNWQNAGEKGFFYPGSF
jgi:hypothetical protein